MKTWRSTLSLAVVLALPLAATAVLPLLAEPAGLRVAAAAAGAAQPDGKKVFLAQKCALCHGLAAQGIEAKTKSEKLKGPDLTGIGDRLKGKEISDLLLRKTKIDGEPHKKEFKGSDEELAALVDWLLEQKAE